MSHLDRTLSAQDPSGSIMHAGSPISQSRLLTIGALLGQTCNEGGGVQQDTGNSHFDGSGGRDFSKRCSKSEGR